MNDSEFFGKVIQVHWAKNSQKQALLGKSKAVWHNQMTTSATTQERATMNKAPFKRGNASASAMAMENREEDGDLVVVDDQPAQKQGLVPMQ